MDTCRVTWERLSKPRTRAISSCSYTVKPGLSGYISGSYELETSAHSCRIGNTRWSEPGCPTCLRKHPDPGPVPIRVPCWLAGAERHSYHSSTTCASPSTRYFGLSESSEDRRRSFSPAHARFSLARPRGLGKSETIPGWTDRRGLCRRFARLDASAQLVQRPSAMRKASATRATSLWLSPGKNGSASERAAMSSHTGNSPSRWPKRSR